MSTRRLALTPAQLQRLLDVLSNSGFSTKRVEISPEGAVTLHADAATPPPKLDLLADWEAKRGAHIH